MALVFCPHDVLHRLSWASPEEEEGLGDGWAERQGGRDVGTDGQWFGAQAVLLLLHFVPWAKCLMGSGEALEPPAPGVGADSVVLVWKMNSPYLRRTRPARAIRESPPSGLEPRVHRGC